MYLKPTFYLEQVFLFYAFIYNRFWFALQFIIFLDTHYNNMFDVRTMHMWDFNLWVFVRPEIVTVNFDTVESAGHMENHWSGKSVITPELRATRCYYTKSNRSLKSFRFWFSLLQFSVSSGSLMSYLGGIDNIVAIIPCRQTICPLDILPKRIVCSAISSSLAHGWNKSLCTGRDLPLWNSLN